ncbi:hypothetical protein HZA43_00740 [Candidatus Peregrinibacteria bacterium]|nr:hypothetical protein [Candidatus Peregrinibacteria bacterium]
MSKTSDEKMADNLLNRQEMKMLLHPSAAAVLNQLANLSSVRQWLIRRFREIHLADHTRSAVHLELNAWNEKGYGLQSMSVMARAQGNPLRLPGEWKDPTIGIVAPDMLDAPGEYGIADFDIDAGKTEECHVLSPGGILLESVIKGKHPDRPPNLLSFGRTTVAYGPDQAMRAFVELAKGSEGPRQKIEAVLKSGVYVCRFLIQR